MIKRFITALQIIVFIITISLVVDYIGETLKQIQEYRTRAIIEELRGK